MKNLLWFVGIFSSLFILILLFIKDKDYSLISSRKLERSVKLIPRRKKFHMYNMSLKEKAWVVAYSGIFLFGIGFLFYRNIILAVIIMPLAFLYPGIREKEYEKLKKRQLNLQFKDALHSISTSLVVGKSLETAFKDAPKELQLLYPDADTTIIMEIQLINRKIEMNATVEEAIKDFAERAELEDIIYFSEVLIICKRTGGNLVEVVKNTARIITEKNDFKQELELMLAQRKFEQKLLALIPLVMLLVLSTTSPDYMEPVFTTFLGRCIMTISICLFALAYYFTNKIIGIEV